MAESFEDLGLRPELARAAAQAGFSQPAPLQRATIPLLRRGGNAIIRASSGSGVTTAWGLPILDRLAAGGEEAEAGERVGGALRALVVTPSTEAAARAAAELAPFAAAAGLRLSALAPGWAPPRGDADVMLAAARDALDAVEASALKMDGLAVFVVTNASSVLAFSGADALDTLGSSLPRDAQRVLTTAQITPEVEDYAERHVRKAVRIPARAAEEQPAAEVVGQIDYFVVREEEKLERITTALEPGTVLFCRSDERAAALAEALALRGFRVGAAGDPDVDAAVASAEAAPEELQARFPISYDVPFDAAQLESRHKGRGGAVLVLARELPHLRRLAQEAALALRPLGGAAVPRQAIDAFRQRLRDAAREEDLEAQLLVLEPLFDERSPAEIAAAASALLRRRGPAAPGAAAGAASRVAAPRAPRAAAAPGAPPPAFTRLFVSVGQRDNIRPGDLVGAIAGEAGIPGDRVGRIEVRDTFSIVEVPADAADRVIRAVNGTTLKGRSVRVDYDRRGTAAAPRRPGPARSRRD